MKTIKYPKIKQFRQVLQDLNHKVTFVSLNEKGEPIYDPSIKKPTITFKGTVKLHGTNAGISYNDENGLYTQSRNNSFTLDKTESHQGFTSFVITNKEEFMRLINEVKTTNSIDTSEFTITIYGEWCGPGIQKGVGISELKEKTFFIFGVKISKPDDSEFDSYWVDSSNLISNLDRIYNIVEFKTYEVEVDLNYPQLSQNKFVELVEKVEKECPVSKQLGIDGIGEGIVWVTEYKDTFYRFKTKGEKHSVSKVKTVASVDVEKINSIKEFVDYSVTENRFNQAIQEVFGSKDEMDVRKMGDFLRWMVNDITSEELDTMKENGLEPKDVNKYISNKSKEMFFEEYNKF